LLLFFLIICIFYDANCRRRRKKCRFGLRMTSKGCDRGRSLTWGLGKINDWVEELWETKSKIEKEIKKEVDIPCYDGSRTEDEAGQQTIYCEVCEVTDTNRVECPQSAQVDNYWELCGKEIFDPSSCAKAKCPPLLDTGDNYVYYQNYDDGSICDCGSPFILTWSSATQGPGVYRRARPSEVLTLPGGIGEGSSVSINNRDAKFKRPWWCTGPCGSNPSVGSPSISGPTSCSSRPDISIIFQDKNVTNSIPLGAGTDFYYEGCPDGRGLRCGGGTQPCWDVCDCRRKC